MPFDLLAKASARDIRLEPFPHLVITDALPPGEMQTLRTSRPHFTDIGWPGEPPSGIRMPCSAHHFQTQDRFAEAWRAFTAQMSSPAVLPQVAELFAEHLPQHCPEVWNWIRSNPTFRSGLLNRDSFPAVEVLTDARLEITTPVKGASRSHRRAHLDTSNRLFTGLYYLRDAEDDLPGGDLGLYRWRSEPSGLSRFEIGEDEVELITTVPYAANTLVLFPNSTKALHGAMPRGEGPYERAYLFFTAEVEHPFW